jgi:hypothetical protein
LVEGAVFAWNQSPSLVSLIDKGARIRSYDPTTGNLDGSPAPTSDEDVRHVLRLDGGTLVVLGKHLTVMKPDGRSIDLAGPLASFAATSISPAPSPGGVLLATLHAGEVVLSKWNLGSQPRMVWGGCSRRVHAQRCRVGQRHRGRRGASRRRQRGRREVRRKKGVVDCRA